VKLTIDNLDGRGAVDYSAAIDFSETGRSEPLAIERTLNAPTIAKGLLCLAGGPLPTPVRQGRVVIASEAGATLFTGYLATEPVAIYAGVASQGPVYRLAFSAVSDEWLLDKQAWGSRTGVALAGYASSVLRQLVTRLDSAPLNTSGLTGGPEVGVFEPKEAAAWAEHAGTLGNATYTAYRALNGILTLTPAATVTHALSDGDGTLSVAGLKTSALRELANDVTVSGAMEPAVYWTELFLGDGSTSVFDLDGEPAAPRAGHATLLDDDFSTGAFDLQTWAISDPGSHLGLGANGLALNGGNGIDGQTTIAAYDPLELGGTIVFELASVALNAGSGGVLGGLYQGATMQANCFAGFSVSQSGGNTILQPMVNGLVTGTPYTIVAGHLYTLRLHLHCPEIVRVKQLYYAMVDGTIQQFGGGVVEAPLALVFEVRDLGSGSSNPVTVLYDGAVASSPVQANVVAANSVQLYGSIGAVVLTRTGSAWITSTDPTTGIVSTRLAGKTYDGVDCRLSSSATGNVTFFAGRVPVANETITVMYRGQRRSVSRIADAASIAAEAAGGSVGTARWVGKVLRPSARSSEDCENAAQAILSFSTNRAAAMTGSYLAVNPPGTDIWPGDVLALTTEGSSTTVLVRKVVIDDIGAMPEALTYRIAFANDWAEGLGIALSEAIAANALLPQTALNLASGAPAPVLANLQRLSLIATSASALTVDAGTDPPTGGGFEVRRHDGGFGTGTSATSSGDLVLRSPVRGFSIPRAAFEEEFFIRMYDASTPPLYSRESSAIVTHLPIA
jgi:hypothetical protein